MQNDDNDFHDTNGKGAEPGDQYPPKPALVLVLYTMSQLKKMLGLSRATINRMQKKGRFPKPKKLTGRSVRWLATEVDQWIRGLEHTD